LETALSVLLPWLMDWMASRKLTEPVIVVSLSVFTVMVAGTRRSSSVSSRSWTRGRRAGGLLARRQRRAAVGVWRPSTWFSQDGSVMVFSFLRATGAAIKRLTISRDPA